MRRFEIEVRTKLIVILILMMIETQLHIVPLSWAAATLLALTMLWTWTERHKERRDRQMAKAPLLIAERAESKVQEKVIDNIMEKNDMPDPEQDPESQGNEEVKEVVSNLVTAGRDEEDDIFTQALKIVAQAEQEHGSISYADSKATEHMSPVKIIRQLLVQCYGEQWSDAKFAHFHTFSGNCLFIAHIVARHSDEETLLHCRVVEVDGEGHFIFPNAIREGEGEG